MSFKSDIYSFYYHFDDCIVYKKVIENEIQILPLVLKFKINTIILFCGCLISLILILMGNLFMIIIFIILFFYTLAGYKKLKKYPKISFDLIDNNFKIGNQSFPFEKFKYFAARDKALLSRVKWGNGFQFSHRIYLVTTNNYKILICKSDNQSEILKIVNKLHFYTKIPLKKEVETYDF